MLRPSEAEIEKETAEKPAFTSCHVSEGARLPQWGHGAARCSYEGNDSTTVGRMARAARALCSRAARALSLTRATRALPHARHPLSALGVRGSEVACWGAHAP
eukprot:1959674-Prymnesium_polylepis.1